MDRRSSRSYYNPALTQQDPQYTPKASDFKIPLRYETSSFPEGMHSQNCVNRNAKSAEGYWIEAGYIKTTYQEGYVCLSYQAFPTDEKGWPLVPDSFSYRQAIYWYTLMKMMEGGFVHPNPEITYSTAIAQWSRYCTQAENEAKFPDIDRAQSFADQWVRLIPNINRHEDFFNDLNQREQLERESGITSRIPTSGVINPDEHSRI